MKLEMDFNEIKGIFVKILNEFYENCERTLEKL